MTEPSAATGQPVEYDLSDGVATLTLNRPEAMNSIDVATRLALGECVARAADDPAVRCVVLTGAGRAFCLGHDLKEHVGLLRDGPSDALFAVVPEHYNPIVRTLATMPKPVVAAVNGVAAGAGASLAFACDLRVLAAGAGFNLAFSGIALSCDTGSSWSLPRLVGPAKALELLYFPRTVGAEEARDLGLASSVVPDDELAGHVRELARRLADGPTVAYGAIRRSVRYSAGHDLEAALAFEAEMMALTGGTEDHRHAVDAFLAKQKPRFRGR